MRALRGGALILAAFVATAAPEAPAAPTCLNTASEAAVVEAIDARAFRLEDGRVLRLAGIEPFSLLLDDAGDAEAALTQRLAALVGDATLRIQIAAKAPDRYGRLPALIAVGDALVQEMLAAEGLAIAFANGDALPCFDRVLAAEAEARSAGRGFWRGIAIPDARPEALQGRIGRFAIFEGTVLTAGTRPATTYLDFGRRWSEDVTIEIAAKDRDAFGGEAELEKLAGSRIRARGFLAEKSGPMLKLRSPADLEIVAPRRVSDRIAP
jgi:endonuclease YncB( thermonuclease family)